MLPDGEVFLMVWLAFVAEEGPTALASFCSTTAVRCDGAGFLIRCRTHPLLAAAIICCPNSCASSAGNTIDSILLPPGSFAISQVPILGFPADVSRYPHATTNLPINRTSNV